MVTIHLVPQFLSMPQHMLHKQQLFPELQSVSSFSRIRLAPHLPNFVLRAEFAITFLQHLAYWIEFALKYSPVEPLNITFVF